jgi:glycosyltransferase involved in cell wall biosynthesis
MKKINIHIYPSSLLFETRIEKIVKCISDSNAFTQIWVIGINGEGLQAFEDKSDGIKFIRVNADRKINGVLGKVLKFILFYFNVIKLLQNVDVGCVNAHSLSVLPLSVLLKTIKKSILIYDTHELETETPSLYGFKKYVAKITEKIFIKKVDHIFCVGEMIALWYEKKYKIAKPTVVLNSPMFVKTFRNNYLREKLKINNDYKICLYFGLLEPHRGIEQLLEASIILEREKIALVFIGYGGMEKEINKYQYTKSNVYLIPPINQVDLLKVASSADIGLCLIEPKSISYNYCMPNKLFEYMAAGLPVVAGPCESLIEFMNNYKVGEIVNKVEADEITDSIIRVKAILNDQLNLHVRDVFKGIAWQEQSKKLISEYSKMKIQ